MSMASDFLQEATKMLTPQSRKKEWYEGISACISILVLLCHLGSSSCRYSAYFPRGWRGSMRSLSEDDLSAEDWRMRFFHGTRISAFFRISYKVKIDSKLNSMFRLSRTVKLMLHCRGRRLLQLIAGNPVPFATMYSLGNIISLCSTCFLYGPWTQAKKMFAPTRYALQHLLLLKRWMCTFHNVSRFI